MILRALCFSRFAALLLVALGFGAAPAAAQGCCYAPAPVYQSCSCCGCGSAYYGSYYGAYAYPSYGYGGGCGGCGYGGYGGYGYGYGAGYAAYDMPAPVVAAPVVAPRIYRRPVYSRYWGPRRPVMARY